MKGLNVTLLCGGHCTCPQHLALRGGRGKIRFPALFALLEHPRLGPMLFDTGYSQRFFEATQNLPERLYRWATPVTFDPQQSAVVQLAERGLAPGDITQVFVSHFHADHVSALEDFPKAKFIHLAEAWTGVRELKGFSAVRRGYLPALVPASFEDRAVEAEKSPLRPLPPGCGPWTQGFDLLGDGSVLAVPLPGHARGQMGLMVQAEDGRIWFFVADAAWLAQGLDEDRRPHWLANLLFDDPRAYRETFRGLKELRQGRSEILVVPSHCEPTYLGLNPGAH